jgi:hypothetical protein
MADNESGLQWWVKNVIVPVTVVCLSSGGIIALYLTRKHSQETITTPAATVAPEVKTVNPLPKEKASPPPSAKHAQTGKESPEPVEIVFFTDVYGKTRRGDITVLPRTTVVAKWQVKNLGDGVTLFLRRVNSDGIEEENTWVLPEGYLRMDMERSETFILEAGRHGQPRKTLDKISVDVQ